MDRENNKQKPSSTCKPKQTELERTGQVINRSAVKQQQQQLHNNNTKKSGEETKSVLAGPKKTTSKMGASHKLVGAVNCKSTKTTMANKQQPASGQLINKKAYVRFDDYLDLNEENMRRSCKRLMNHLYSDSNTACSSSSSPCPPVAPAVICRQSPAKCLTPPSTPGFKSSTSSGNNSDCGSAGSGDRTLLPTTTPTRTTTTTTGGGKSYLRSQYERRQLRQLELINKMQEETSTGAKQNQEQRNYATGAGDRRQQLKEQQHQQDLVAKSHELSKRRFFEKLERRESTKNSNLNNRPAAAINSRQHQHKQPTPITNAKIKTNQAKVSSPFANGELDERQIGQYNELYNSKSNGNGDNDVDKLLFGVQQSFVSELGVDSSRQQEFELEAKELESPSADMLGGLGGATQTSHNIKVGDSSTELAYELIGFYTPSPQLSAADELTERLIDFSVMAQQAPGCQEFARQLVTQGSSGDQARPTSDFEIQVPITMGLASQQQQSSLVVVAAPGNDQSAPQSDGSISCSTGLLVVKQVEKAQGSGGQVRELLCLTREADTEFDGMPPTSIGRNNDGQTSHAAIQLASIKTKTPLMVDLADNEKQIKHQQLDFSNEKTKPSSIEKMLVNVGQEKDTAYTTTAPPSSSPSIGSDNQPKQVHQATVSSGAISASSGNNKMKIISSLAAMTPSEELEVDGRRTTGNGGSCGASDVEGSTAVVGGGGKSNSLQQFTYAGINESSSATNGADCTAAGDHDTPETKMQVVVVVEQSDGATAQQTATDSTQLTATAAETAISSPQPVCAYPVRAQSCAALAQQVVVNSQVTAITKSLIRDVLPEANPTDRMVALVSADQRDQAVSTASVMVTDEKVTDVAAATCDQVNEKQQNQTSQLFGVSSSTKKQAYANDEQVDQVKREVAEEEENNFINYHVDASEGTNNNTTIMPTPTTTNATIDYDDDHVKKGHTDLISQKDSHNRMLIESFANHPANGHASLVKKSSTSTSTGCSGGEEDAGSSCGSSGFGASVSVTSSSDVCCSASFLLNEAHVDHSKLEPTVGSIITDEHQFRSMKFGGGAFNNQRQDATANGDPIYDSVRNSRARYQSNEFPDYNLPVVIAGPARMLVQHHPKVSAGSSAVLVENHNYAVVDSLKTASSCEQQPARLDSSSIVLERDDVVEVYANLPLRNKNVAEPIEYATVRLQTNTDPSKARQPNGKVFGRGQNNQSDGASLSERSCATGSTSTNSGGFSALPPARLNCYPPAANSDFRSLVSLAEGPNQKKSSLLKRFGSLVSKAFSASATSTTANNSQQSQSPELVTTSGTSSNISNKDLLCSTADQSTSQPMNNYTRNSQSKLALVIERNYDDGNADADAHHHDEHRERRAATIERQTAQVGQADLVILPTKHVNQQRLEQTGAKQQPASSATVCRLLDDRLSRGRKNRSRKYQMTKHTDFSSSTSSSVTSISSASSDTNNKLQYRNHERHPRRRADSLSEELESLMSRSSSIKQYHQQSKESKSSLQQKAHLKSLAPLAVRPKSESITKSTQGRFDIDCTLPRMISSVKQQVDDSEIEQPTSGFWGLTRLIGRKVSSEQPISMPVTATSWSLKKNPPVTKISAKNEIVERDACDSLTYANVQPLSVGYSRIKLPDKQQLMKHELEYKHSSPNLCQNLLRNYERRHHHHRHHRQHHHHHHHRSSSGRHASQSIKRCAKSCHGQRCHHSVATTTSSESENYSTHSACKTNSTVDGKASAVWGQLIKINKSNGSQVIELQRAPNKPWGFFVARGAINNNKGIFISRMHDNLTSNSLAGLLSIGDRILAIDDCPIEPDHDILRVNQLISKKSKILLKVNPFKG